MSRKTYLAAGLVFAGVAALGLALFQVDTTEYAIVTQFGKPVRILQEPGLYAKFPDPVQSVTRLDRRLQVHNLPETEFLTRDKKNVLTEAFATWQVTDPLQFFKSVRDASGAATRLADILASELGAALGSYELGSLVNTATEAIRLPELLTQVATRADARTRPYGFTVAEVSLKSLNFPQTNRQSVFQRMRAERERIARQFRSEGTEESTKIRADAEAERTTILSEAQRQAEELRGQGEAEAIRVYAESFGKAPEFYQFVRTLQSYDKVITNGTTMILPSDSELLKYLSPKSLASAPTAMAGDPAAGAQNRPSR